LRDVDSEWLDLVGLVPAVVAEERVMAISFVGWTASARYDRMLSS